MNEPILPRQPFVGAEQAAQFLGISQQRLRQLVENRELLVLRIGGRYAYPVSDLKRVLAMRADNEVFTQVASLLTNPTRPLRLAFSQVMAFGDDSIRRDEVFVRVWSGGGSNVVVLAPVDNDQYVATAWIEEWCTQIDERILGGEGGQTAWFIINYEGTPEVRVTLRVVNVVMRAAPVRPVNTERGMRGARFSDPQWLESSVTDILRITGQRVLTMFPWKGNNRDVVERFARTGEPPRAIWDRDGAEEKLQSLREILAGQGSNPQLAARAAKVVADDLVWSDDGFEKALQGGWWYDGSLSEPGVVMGAVLQPYRLDLAEKQMVADARKGLDLPAGIDLESLYAGLRNWQEQTDSYAEHPNTRLGMALDYVARLCGRYTEVDSFQPSQSIEEYEERDRRRARFLAYPRWSTAFYVLSGVHDFGYRRTWTPDYAPNGREFRILRQKIESAVFIQSNVDDWKFCRDRDGRLVAHVDAHDKQYWTCLWPIDPPTSLPDNAKIVANDGAWGTAAYIAYDDGTLSLLPKTGDRCEDGWGFGYDGGGPGHLAAAILEVYGIARNVPFAELPRSWVYDAVSHSDHDQLCIGVSQITRRIRSGRGNLRWCTAPDTRRHLGPDA